MPNTSTVFSCKKPIAMRRDNVSTIPEWQLYDGSIMISYSHDKNAFKVFLDDFQLHRNTKKIYIGLITVHETSAANIWHFNNFANGTKIRYGTKQEAVDAAISYLESVMSCKVAKVKTDNKTYWRTYYKSTIPQHSVTALRGTK